MSLNLTGSLLGLDWFPGVWLIMVDFLIDFTWRLEECFLVWKNSTFMNIQINFYSPFFPSNLPYFVQKAEFLVHLTLSLCRTNFTDKSALQNYFRYLFFGVLLVGGPKNIFYSKRSSGKQKKYNQPQWARWGRSICSSDGGIWRLQRVSLGQSWQSLSSIDKENKGRTDKWPNNEGSSF